MTWVSSKEKHEDYIRFGGIPVRKAVLQTGIVDEPKYRWLKPYIESMPHGKSYGMGGSPRAPFPEWGEIQEPIGLALSQALVKERKVKEALDWAAGEAEKVLKKAGYDKQYGWS
jgi:multiple sugar transport system substrate-binding protein